MNYLNDWLVLAWLEHDFSFPEFAGPDSSCLLCGTIGHAQHAAPAVVAKSVSPICVTAVAHWKDPHLYQTGVQLGLTSRKKVVTTDASNLGWGALSEVRPAFGSWSSLEQCLHINCLEMMAFLAFKTLLPALVGGGGLHKLPRRPEVMDSL